MHKHPLKSAGFKVLKAPDVPSVLIELGYVSSKDDLKQLTSGAWRARTAGADRAGDRQFFQHPDRRRRRAGAGRPMTGKPQFEHKNPRFFAAQARVQCPAAVGLSTMQTAVGTDVRSVGLMALPERARGRGRSVRADGTSAMRLLLRFCGFLFAAGTIVFLVGVGAARRPALAFLQGPAGLFAVAGLRAAGDDPRACRRRLAGRRIRHPAPALHSDPGRAEDGDQRLPRRRGQEFLRAQRPRLRRHRPRRHALCAELRLGPPAAGRLHHHPAGRQELPADQRGLVPAQDQGGAARAQDRARLFQGEDPRALSQRDLSRPRRLRRRRGLAALFRQVGARADRRRRRPISRRCRRRRANYNPFRQRDRAHRAAQLRASTRW